MSASTSSSLVGVWRLLAYELHCPGEVVRYPLGRDARGQLIYGEGGAMSVHLMRANRPAFAAQTPLAASDREIRDAFEGYNGYFGRYSVDAEAGRIVHFIDGAWFPNWVQARLSRDFRLDGSRLTLSATIPAEGAGKVMTAILVWRRSP